MTMGKGMGMSRREATFAALVAFFGVVLVLTNIVGGTLLVAGIYWFVYLRPERKMESPARPGPGD